MAGALPPIDSALLPASVRNAGPQAQKLYSAALSFEQQLTQKLAESLASTLQDPSGGDDGEGSGGSSSTAMVQEMLPDALAQGMTEAGGLGLANQLYEALGGREAARSAKAGA
jgi:Rod binding domain-containing protein